MFPLAAPDPAPTRQISRDCKRPPRPVIETRRHHRSCQIHEISGSFDNGATLSVANETNLGPTGLGHPFSEAWLLRPPEIRVRFRTKILIANGWGRFHIWSRSDPLRERGIRQAALAPLYGRTSDVD
jgi:hypothetical protein